LFLFGERITNFSQINKPKLIEVGENLIYINDGASVLLYDLNNFKLIKNLEKKVKAQESSLRI
jgi:hypothetical protein